MHKEYIMALKPFVQDVAEEHIVLEEKEAVHHVQVDIQVQPDQMRLVTVI